jgi:hypothetical protein
MQIKTTEENSPTPVEQLFFFFFFLIIIKNAGQDGEEKDYFVLLVWVEISAAIIENSTEVPQEPEN